MGDLTRTFGGLIIFAHRANSQSLYNTATIHIYTRYVSNNINKVWFKYIYDTSIYIFVSKLFPKYIFSISNILENIIIFYLKHNVKIMI